MSEPPPTTNDHFVYRVINPTNWDKAKDRPKPTAFKQSQGRALSVFSAELQTPRGALQHHIDAWNKQLVSDEHLEREKAARNLADFGDTVEKLVDNGYHVVRVPLIEFARRDFEISDPEPNGHRDIRGDFDTHKRDLALAAEPLSSERCLM